MRRWCIVLLFTVETLLLCSHASTTVWKVVKRTAWEEQTPGRNRRLEEVSEKHFVRLEAVQSEIERIQKNALKDDLYHRGDAEDNVLTFQLPDKGAIECEIGQNEVLPKSLLEAYPDLYSLAGKCNDGSYVFLNGQLNSAGQLSATFVTQDNDFIYVDSMSAGSDLYVVYRFKEGLAAGAKTSERFSCGVDDHSHEDRRLQDSQEPDEESRNPHPKQRLRAIRELAESVTNGYKFKIAIVTTKEYSQYHGNTVSSVLSSLVTLLTRANGVYLRELGIFFELFEQNDKLICLNGDADCENLENGVGLVTQTGGFIASKGIRSSDFDVGHGLATAGGGRAAYPGLCSSARAEAMTGLANPDTDAFYVDYFCHELGHTLLGAHSFRDCGDQLMLDGAVEPGSGSSIMGYAGICNSKNLASNSDPYFNSNNLVDMKNFIVEKFKTGSCGERVETGRQKPQVSAPTQCQIPVGMKFQLRGTSEEDSLWYSWERIDRGAEEYLDRTVARFRSWKPRSVPMRHFPSLYYSMFNLETSQLNEILPGRNQEMKFRFTGRRIFNPTGTAQSFSTDLIGDFGFQDTIVQFTSTIKPLQLEKFSKLKPFSEHTFRWDPGTTDSLSPNVNIYFAVKTMTLQESFEYEKHEVEPEWFVIGRNIPNNGEATLEIPQVFNDKEAKVIVIIRSTDDACYFYDILPAVTLESVPGLPNAVLAESKTTESGLSAWVIVLIVFACLASVALVFFLNRKLKKYDLDFLPPPPPIQSIAAAAIRRLSRSSSVNSSSAVEGRGRIRPDHTQSIYEENESNDGGTWTAKLRASVSRQFSRTSFLRSSMERSVSQDDGGKLSRTSLSFETCTIPEEDQDDADDLDSDNEEEEEDQVTVVGPSPDRAAEIASFKSRLSFARKAKANQPPKPSLLASHLASKSPRKKKEFVQQETVESDEEEVEDGNTNNSTGIENVL